MRALLFSSAVLLLATACDSSTTVEPTPSPTVTVTATATETVTAEPTEPDAVADPCATLVDGDSLAFVFVTAPVPGATVSSGFTFSGCSNAFEAAHQWRLLDRDGRELASGFGSATCGTGCVGTFQQTVEFTVGSRQVGRLEVFTTSAQDGSVQDLNAIPLVLEP